VTLRSSRWARRAMRPTDFCHLHDWRAPVPRELLASSRLSPREHPMESWAPCGLPGNRVFHDTRERFGGSQLGHTLPCPASPTPGGVLTRAWALSSHGAHCDRASDTPVASRLPPTCASGGAVSVTHEPPRSPCPPPRERGWLVTTRSAFHRQGPFQGSGGLYSPGPTTAQPLLAPWTTAG